MKCLIVTYDEYLNIPYIQNYERCLRDRGIAYDIVLWDRSGYGDGGIRNAYVFHGQNRPSRLGKLVPFLRWRGFVLRRLREGGYDRLVVLTTIPAVLLADRLLHGWRGRYWLDIRDFTYENLGIYRKLVGKLTCRAGGASISSEGFRHFLPEGCPVCLTHNLTNDGEEEAHCGLNPDRAPLVIGFVGGLRYEEQNCRLLQQLAGSRRYTLRYVGKSHPGCDLPAFCRRSGIENAEFFPAYRNEEKPALYRSIDLINCVYGADTEVTRLALPNKLYDCVLFKKPILVSENTYLAEIVLQYGLGLAVALERESVEARLDAYFAAFDREAFEDGCRRFLQRSRQEQKRYLAALGDFFDGEEQKTS